MGSLRKYTLLLLKITDVAVVTVACILAIALTGGAADVHGWVELLEVRIQLKNFLFMLTYLWMWHLILNRCELYRSYRLSRLSRELRDIGVAVGLSTAPLVPLAPIFDLTFVTLPFLMTFAAAAFLGLSLERRILRAVGVRVRRYGRNLRNVILVGTDDDALELTAKLARREDLGYNVVSVIEAGPNTDPRSILAKIEALILDQPIDEVFVALPIDTSHQLIQSIIAVCEQQGITFRLLASLANLFWARARIDTLEGQPVLTVYTGQPDPTGLLIKRGIDVVGAGLALVLFAPLFLVVAALIKIDSNGGPVFFYQKRVGLGRRRFWAIKFRTMVEGAEELQPALEPLNEAEGPVFKIANDPRVTRVGRWLRRLSIDELPQFLNVVRGEMSLVGPRPLPTRDVKRIEVRWHNRRFSVKPGITCLWQINSRRPHFDEWIRWDMEYIDNWSVGLDLKILFRTIPAVLSGQGAS
jgi:exopolysaccharide biosynthesis polyprenyl glycosylphosphotransferase